tara:strand:- start:3088 stop:3627 length:540 start_codon:yes stop_codon:yes gene_type:complete
MKDVETKVADYIGKNPAFRMQVAKFLLSQELLEEGYTLSSSEPEVTTPPKQERVKNTTTTGHVLYWSNKLLNDRAEEVARIIQELVPDTTLDGCRGKNTNGMKSVVHNLWRGKKAVDAVELALGEPNSIKSRRTIGRQTASRFVNRFLVPYFLLEDRGHFDKADPSKGMGLEDLIASNL